MRRNSVHRAFRASLIPLFICALFLSAGARAFADDQIIAKESGPEPTPAPQGPLYNMGAEIYSIDRATTFYYYYQGNTDGSYKAKRELRYSRDLWNDNAQLQIRVPEYTSYPVGMPAFSGLGNIELGYSYNVSSSRFDHSLEFRVSLPTAGYNVSSNDTELKGFYTTKWRWKGGAVSYVNEYDQTILKPPGSTWTSYYDGKVTLPDFPVTPGVKVSAIYEGRFVFSSGGIFRDVVGGTIFGSLKNVALSIIDTWGIGPNALWKYKLEFNATGRF